MSTEKKGKKVLYAKNGLMMYRNGCIVNMVSGDLLVRLVYADREMEKEIFDFLAEKYKMWPKE